MWEEATRLAAFMSEGVNKRFLNYLFELFLLFGSAYCRPMMELGAFVHCP